MKCDKPMCTKCQVLIKRNTNECPNCNNDIDKLRDFSIYEIVEIQKL